MKKVLNYSEGTIFALKLRTDGFAVGIVTRIAKRKGGIIMAYFSDKKFPVMPSLTEVENLTEFLFKWRLGDLFLINNTWFILGQKQNFKSEDWPIPKFIRRDPLVMGRAWEVTYREDDIATVQSETLTDSSREDLDESCLMGAGAVEIRLSKLIR